MKILFQSFQNLKNYQPLTINHQPKITNYAQQLAQNCLYQL